MAAHLIVALIHLGIAVYATREALRRRSLPMALIAAVVYGLAYDAAVLTLGGVLDAGAPLKALNAPRYWTHALLTPTTMWVALAGLAATGHERAAGSRWRGTIGPVPAAVVALGAWTDIVGLTLEPVTERGITRYVNGFSPIPGPPVAAVVTIVVVLAIGVMIWRRSGWPWLAVGATVMFVTAGMQGQLVAQHVGEIAYAAALVFTLTRERVQVAA